MTLRVLAGSVSFLAGNATRLKKAVELLALHHVGQLSDHLPVFGPPDVSNETFNASMLEHVPATDHLLLYVMSCLGNADQLAASLTIGSVSDDAMQACVAMARETSSGDFLSCTG